MNGGINSSFTFPQFLQAFIGIGINMSFVAPDKILEIRLM